MREELSKPTTLAYYDHRKPTRLYTDASRLHGLGFVLKQQQSDGTWRIVQAGSRYLSGAEERYAMVELELLAIAWACQKTASFIEGINFTIVTDHKPLIPILRDYSLAEIENRRLQRLRMKVDHLSYEVTWVKGQDNVEADALSRAPASRPRPEDEIDEPQANTVALSILMEPKTPNVNHVFGAPHYDQAIDEAINEDNQDPLIQTLLEEAEKDEIYLQLREWIKSGFPDREGVEVKFDPYLREQDCLRLDKNGVILYQSKDEVFSPPRLFVPESLRRRYIDLIKLLHSHPNKMVARARKSLWWPFMNSEIQREHRQCMKCVEKSPSNPQDVIRSHEPADYPFQKMHMDFGHYGGKVWLFGADQFSGWPIVKCFGNDAPAEKLVQVLNEFFQLFGYPEQIFSDGGPQFVAKAFTDFCKKNFIECTTSSPGNPQSNGVAENAVKQMKKLVHCLWDASKKKVDSDEWSRAFLVYVNTPRRPLGRSPAEILYGRNLRDGVPQPKEAYLPQHQAAIQRRCQAIKDHKLGLQKPDQLKPLSVGQRVAIQDRTTNQWDRFGAIESIGRRRTYYVRTDSGALLWRNRRFLKPVPCNTSSTPNSSPAPNPGSNSPSRKSNANPGTPTPLRRSSRIRRQPDRFQPGQQ